jgi:hypothetical protein
MPMCVVSAPFSNLRVIYSLLTLQLTAYGVDNVTINILPGDILQKPMRI